MNTKRDVALSLLFPLVVSFSTPTLAAKVDYSLISDKATQAIEDHWDPRAGLPVESEITETEPNDVCPGQSLACGDAMTQATLVPGDVDYISFNASAGDMLILGTDSAGGLDPDTKITLLDGCNGTTLATDDDGGPGLFSRLAYLAPTTGTYLLRIEGNYSAVTGDYIAYVACAPRDPADICDTAPELPCGSFSIDGSTLIATNDYDLTDGAQNDCTGYATAGSDLVYVITEPAFTLSVTYTSTVDGAIYLITDCSNPRGSCVAGSDITLAGQPETLIYESTGGGPYYLVLDNFLGDAGPAGDFTLTGYLDCPPPRWVNTGGYTNSGPGLGVAWGDYDNDGDLDIYLSKYGEANQLLRSNGAGGFSSVTNALLNDAGYGRGTAWADYDNDGDLDLYLVNANTANKLFRNDGGGNFTDVSAPPLDDMGDGRGTAWADYDNDGDVDLYVVNAYSTNRLFENDGAGGFRDVTSPPLDDQGLGTGCAWADYDNDGDLDLYVAKHGAANKLFRNDGTGSFTDVTSPPLDDAGSGRGVAWGDYDNDGDLDLFLVNANSANKLFRNEGDGSFSDVTTTLLGNADDGRGVEWGDYDNDGDLDLYVTNVLSANKYFENDGSGNFSDATSVRLGDLNSAQGVATADYDNDGDLDLYVVNAFNFDLRLRNDLPAGNHWLHVDLTGTLSNRSAIGARVRVVAGGKSQIREISGGSGYLSQGSLTAEFGLGTVVTIDTLEVLWPSGIVQDSLNVAVDQRLSLTEADPSVDVGDLSLPRRLTLLPNVPDPFNPWTEIRYILPGPSQVSIEIYDARGRAVRHLFKGSQDRGLQSARWNGVDDAGASLPSGTYMVHIDTDHGGGTEKVTLLK